MWCNTITKDEPVKLLSSNRIVYKVSAYLIITAIEMFDNYFLFALLYIIVNIIARLGQYVKSSCQDQTVVVLDGWSPAL